MKRAFLSSLVVSLCLAACSQSPTGPSVAPQFDGNASNNPPTTASEGSNTNNGNHDSGTNKNNSNQNNGN